MAVLEKCDDCEMNIFLPLIFLSFILMYFCLFLQSKEREALDALKINVSSPQLLVSSESQPPEIAEKDQEETERKHETTWEQRYEKLWVEVEKKDTKSQYMNVAAELKEMFGEIEQKLPKMFEQSHEEGAVEEEYKQHPEASECVCENSSDNKEELVQPTARKRNVRLLTILEQRESDLEDASFEDDYVRDQDLGQRSLDTSQTTDNHHIVSAHDINDSTNIGKNKEQCRSACKRHIEADFVKNPDNYKEANTLLLVNEPVYESKPDEFFFNSDEEVEEGLHSSVIKVGDMLG